ncbi:MAG: restriction endonuclease subunit R, partial [Bacillota bacterium]|nr:restriction endonuclease subunit R [Bacillota bacterium]
MQFFLTLNKDDNVSFSPVREMDRHSEVTSYLNVPLDLLTIQIVLKRLLRRSSASFWFKASKRKNVKVEILEILKALGWEVLALRWEDIGISSEIHQNRGDKEDEVFNRLVSGRQLSSGDLHRLARELRISDETIIRLAHRNVEQGRALWVPAVKPRGRGWQCQRCGEMEVEEWPSPHGTAATCRSCESIGPSTSLDA